MKVTEHEMRGLLTGKCVPGNMKVNEELPAYLVRQFASLHERPMLLNADREKIDRAKRLHERQRHYDMLHHKHRILCLSNPPCLFSDGSTIPEHFRINLLNSSRELVSKGMSCNSVDLNDVSYLAQLDEFERVEVSGE